MARCESAATADVRRFALVSDEIGRFLLGRREEVGRRRSDGAARGLSAECCRTINHDENSADGSFLCTGRSSGHQGRRGMPVIFLLRSHPDPLAGIFEAEVVQC